MKFAYLGRS